MKFLFIFLSNRNFLFIYQRFNSKHFNWKITFRKKTNTLDISNQPIGTYFILLYDNLGHLVQRSKVTKE